MKSLNEAMVKLNEKRYYYGEIEHAKDLIDQSVNSVSKAVEFVTDISYGGEDDEYEYSKEQFEVIKTVIINLENISRDLTKVKDKLTKNFENHIRTLTPEEREEMKKLINGGK